MAINMMPQKVQFILFQSLVLSEVDYGFGLLSLTNAQLKLLETIQNERMCTILGFTRDTSSEAMRHILGLPSMAEGHKIA